MHDVVLWWWWVVQMLVISQWDVCGDVALSGITDIRIYYVTLCQPIILWTYYSSLACGLGIHVEIFISPNTKDYIQHTFYKQLTISEIIFAYWITDIEKIVVKGLVTLSREFLTIFSDASDWLTDHSFIFTKPFTLPTNLKYLSRFTENKVWHFMEFHFLSSFETLIWHLKFLFPWSMYVFSNLASRNNDGLKAFHWFE